MRVLASILLAFALIGTAQGQCEVKLEADVREPKGRLGASVDIAGSAAVVGRPRFSGGQAFVFDPSWTHHKFELSASDAKSGDEFGAAVALNMDLVVVGAPKNDDFGSGSGSAYVFDLRSGQQIRKLLPPGGSPGDGFGTSVAIAGNRIAVGAPGSGWGGKVYVFDAVTLQELYWTTGSDTQPGDRFGTAIAMDEQHLIVGDPGHDHLAIGDAGSAYLFDVSTGQELAEFLSDDARFNDYFGASVGIDGARAAVGAPSADAFGIESGIVYVFDVSTAKTLFKIKGKDSSNYDEFGTSVAVSGDYVVAGAPRDDPGEEFFNESNGSAYVFDAYTGKELFQLTASDDEPGDFLGASIAIDWPRILTGAPWEGPQNAGSAYLFLFPTGIGTTYCAARANSTGLPGSIAAQGTGVAVCGQVLLLGTDLPPLRIGYFLASFSKGFVPFVGGSQGHLCLGTPTARFASQAQFTGAEGRLSVLIDLEPLPPPLTGKLQPGDTLHFQAWFRDLNPGPTSNLTNGLSITFE